ncbi:hypothetical protein GCM10027295_16730 [Pseudaeromonas pectinilytica]
MVVAKDPVHDSWLGIETEMLAGGSWDVYDGSVRDKDRLKGRFPTVPWDTTKVELLAPAPNLMMLIRRGK